MYEKIIFLIIISLIFTYCFASLFSNHGQSIFAISSDLEYQEIKENLNDNNHMYFQWGRLARNSEDIIQFTDKMYFGISSYDNRTEYGFPTKIAEENI